jgi:hypothetical protein
MDIFTTEELRIIAQILDTTPVQGTLHTLPALLSKLTHIRIKLQGLIEAIDKEQAQHEVLAKADVAPETNRPA